MSENVPVSVIAARMSSESLRPLPAASVVRLMREMIECLRQHLRGPVTALFDAVDDTLFEMSEHATNGESQQRYFVSLRECRRKRGELQEMLLLGLGQARPAMADEPVHPLYAQLSLVAPEDLEEDLAINGMATRTAQRLSGPLYTLTQRIGFLLGDPLMDGLSNPLGPLRIGQVFGDAARDLDVDLQTRLVIYKLFERQVLGALEPAYSEMNVRLAAAGVLATLNPRQTREASRTRSAPQSSTPRHVDMAASPATTTASLPPMSEASTVASSTTAAAAISQQERDLLAALRVLLTRPSTADTATSAPSGTDSATASAIPNPAPESANAPSQMLEQAMARLCARSTDQPPPPPRMLAAQLLAEARYAEHGLPPSPQQTATVDIVGRVFDALSRDTTVPQPMQPVMQTLLLPVMRASLQQPGMLAETAHPLRQLLDLIVEQAIGWCPRVDPQHALLDELQHSLRQIASSERVEDAERTITQLRGQLDIQRRRAELAEQRAVEATAGRERLWHARREVHQTVSAILARAPAPAWVSYLITHPWANCLVLLWLRQGAQSTSYREAVQFAESLVWCVTAGTDRVEQLRLRALLPVMEVQLRQGLSTVAYQDNEVRQLIGELQQFLHYRMGELAAPVFLEQEPPAARAPGAIATDPAAIEDQPQPQDVDAQLLERIRALRPGTWFEFGIADADLRERGRLSWVSPYSGRCMFVNRNGLKIAERRPEQLASEIEQGLSSVLEDANLLKRALASVLAQLRGEQPTAVRSA